MQFSGDVPYGPKAIGEHLASGQTLRMNVTKEADAAFMAELQRTDPQRYANLMRNMRLDVRRQRANQEGTAEFAAKLSQWRKAAIRRAKKTGVLPTGWKWCARCKEPFEPHRLTTETCSSRCAYRVKQNPGANQGAIAA